MAFNAKKLIEFLFRELKTNKNKLYFLLLFQKNKKKKKTPGKYAKLFSVLL